MIVLVGMLLEMDAVIVETLPHRTKRGLGKSYPTYSGCGWTSPYGAGRNGRLRSKREKRIFERNRPLIKIYKEVKRLLLFKINE